MLSPPAHVRRQLHQNERMPLTSAPLERPLFASIAEEIV
jgi:hypothetical protein